MKKVYVVLLWFYEGDSNLHNTFIGAYLTREEALKNCDKDLKFITFINYDTKETSDVYIEGYDPVEYGQYGSECKNEIREIVFKDYSDWDIENPEKVECCSKCQMPNKQVVNSKALHSTGYYVCLCRLDSSKVLF